MGKKKPKYTVMILEDEPFVMKMLVKIVEDAGYKVIQANSPEKALKKVEDNKIDLFLADILIPKRHGIAVAWEMRTKGYEFPIVILSAFLDQWDKEVMKDCKIDRWISKPAKPKVLLDAMRILLEG